TAAAADDTASNAQGGGAPILPHPTRRLCPPSAKNRRGAPSSVARREQRGVANRTTPLFPRDRRRGGIPARIAVDVVVAVAQHTGRAAGVPANSVLRDPGLAGSHRRGCP